MHRSLIFALVAAALALSGCSSSSTSTAPARASTPPTSASAKAAVADLPPAPPVDSWVRRGSDFQMTIDLNMQTELIEIGLSPAAASKDAARAYAYHVCSTLRSKPKADSDELVTSVYPTADQTKVLGMILAAQAYCLDTV